MPTDGPPEKTEESPKKTTIALTSVGADGRAASGGQVGTATGIQTGYNPLPDQEKARAYIAYILLGTMVGSIIFIAIAGAILAEDCYTSPKCMSAKESMNIVIQIMSLIFTPIVGLVGSVIGFYFGSKAAAER